MVKAATTLMPRYRTIQKIDWYNFWRGLFLVSYIVWIIASLLSIILIFWINTKRGWYSLYIAIISLIIMIFSLIGLNYYYPRE
jgi:hypothetical protein